MRLRAAPWRWSRVGRSFVREGVISASVPRIRWGGAPSPWPPSWKEGGRREEWVMEAHPPYLLPEGRRPSGLPLLLPAPDCFAAVRNDGVGAHPPYRLPEGGAPLDSPLRMSGLECVNHVSEHPSMISLVYTPTKKGEINRGSEGHPQTPAKEAVPLWTPPRTEATCRGNPCGCPRRRHIPQTPAKGRCPLDSRVLSPPELVEEGPSRLDLRL